MPYQKNNNQARRNRPRPGGTERWQKPQNRNGRPPLPEGFSLFYIAIQCPAEIDAAILQMKDYMQQQYGSRAARKSPAHLTIVPPFRAEDEMEKALTEFVETFNMGMAPFDITLKDYGQFSDRVLFVDVAQPHDALIRLEAECMEEFTQHFPGIIFGMKPEFNPHVTIATRDIPEGKIAEARSYFELHHPFEATFNARGISLFKLVKGWWQVVQ